MIVYKCDFCGKEHTDRGYGNTVSMYVLKTATSIQEDKNLEGFVICQSCLEGLSDNKAERG